MNGDPGNDTELLQFGTWTVRVRPALKSPGRLLLLLHGWTGDENSMWLFGRDFPAEFTLLAPRAPLAASEGGYTWREMTSGTWGLPALDDFRPAVGSLLAFVDAWAQSAGVDASTFDLMGFSQGAALTYVLTALHPGRVGRLAALAGFLPEGAETLLTGRPLAGKPVYVAHGVHDEMVPVERARRAVTQLGQAGAQVTYCEAETGHKVSPDCFRGLREFFTQ
jgi:phospholipase/carboxylesterase